MPADEWEADPDRAAAVAALADAAAAQAAAQSAAQSASAAAGDSAAAPSPAGSAGSRVFAFVSRLRRIGGPVAERFFADALAKTLSELPPAASPGAAAAVVAGPAAAVPGAGPGKGEGTGKGAATDGATLKWLNTRLIGEYYGAVRAALAPSLIMGTQYHTMPLARESAARASVSLCTPSHAAQPCSVGQSPSRLIIFARSSPAHFHHASHPQQTMRTYPSSRRVGSSRLGWWVRGRACAWSGRSFSSTSGRRCSRAVARP